MGPALFCPLRGLSPASEEWRDTPLCAPWVLLPWLGGRAWQVRFPPLETADATSAHGQPRVDAAPGRVSPACLDQGAGPFTELPPTAPLLSPPHRARTRRARWGHRRPPLGPMPTPTRSLSGPCPPARCDQTAAVLTCWEGVRTTLARATRTQSPHFLPRGGGNPGRLFTV